MREIQAPEGEELSKSDETLPPVIWLALFGFQVSGELPPKYTACEYI